MSAERKDDEQCNELGEVYLCDIVLITGNICRLYGPDGLR